MKYKFQIANVTISSDDQSAQERVFALLQPHFTKQEVIDAVLSASIDGGPRGNQHLAADLQSNTERHNEALRVLKLIHQQE